MSPEPPPEVPERTEGRDAPAAIWSWLAGVVDSRRLFPLIAAVLLMVIWAATWMLIRAHHAGVEERAEIAVVDLAQTYEAQVVRALIQIDATLKLIRYAYAMRPEASVLSELGAHGLLPLDLLFEVSITDAKGQIVASTRDRMGTSVAGQDFFEMQRQTEGFVMSEPRLDPSTGEWSVYFSRRIAVVDNGFAGVVVVATDPAYFVSSYEAATMGERGMLGVLGSNGRFSALRTGDTVSYGDTTDYSSEFSEIDDGAASAVKVSVSPWDGERRYTTAIELFSFPATVVVGLSEREQLAAGNPRVVQYLWSATIASGVALVFVTILGRMSWQLQQSQMRLMQQQVITTERMEHLAYHDSLTGLPNRGLFSKLLTQIIRQADRHGRHVSLLFLDLDGFKTINDTLGHDAGDDLLKEIARRLTALLRGSDTVCRLGGDEFVVLLPETTEEKYLTAVATKILDALSQPFELDQQKLRITVSIGISTYPQDGQNEQALMKNADIAMYDAKQGGKNNFRFYSPALTAEHRDALPPENNPRRRDSLPDRRTPD